MRGCTPLIMETYHIVRIVDGELLFELPEESGWKPDGQKKSACATLAGNTLPFGYKDFLRLFGDHYLRDWRVGNDSHHEEVSGLGLSALLWAFDSVEDHDYSSHDLARHGSGREIAMFTTLRQLEQCRERLPLEQRLRRIRALPPVCVRYLELRHDAIWDVEDWAIYLSPSPFRQYREEGSFAQYMRTGVLHELSHATEQRRRRADPVELLPLQNSFLFPHAAQFYAKGIEYTFPEFVERYDPFIAALEESIVPGRAFSFDPATGAFRDKGVNPEIVTLAHL